VPPSRTQTTLSARIRQLQVLDAEVQRLEADKTTALQKVGQLQNQQASTPSFLQQTAASVQNLSLASTATQQVVSQSNATTLDQLATMIEQRFNRVENNINILNLQAHRCHDKYLARFRNIERRLAIVEGNPVAPQPLSPPANL